MNGNITIERYQAEHVKGIQLLERDQWLIDSGRLFTFALRHERAGIGYTLYYKEAFPIMCGGVDLWWDNVGEAWMLITPYAKKYAVSVVRAIKKLLPHVIELMSLKRVQATIRVTDEPSIKFAEMLGFEREGRLKQFGIDGTDYYMYGRVQ